MKQSPIGKLIEAAERFIEVADLGPSTEAYEKALRKLQVEIKAASQVLEDWQPIETAPKDGTNILVWCPERNRVYLVYWDEFADGWFAFTDRWISKAVSHWMPVPKPPSRWPQGGKVSEIKYGGHTAAELAKLEAAATPGPWVGDRYDSTVKYAILSGGGYRVYNVNCDPPDDASYVTYGDEDTNLTMAARNALPDLLARIKQLEAENGRLREAREKVSR